MISTVLRNVLSVHVLLEVNFPGAGVTPAALQRLNWEHRHSELLFPNIRTILSGDLEERCCSCQHSVRQTWWCCGVQERLWLERPWWPCIARRRHSGPRDW